MNCFPKKVCNSKDVIKLLAPRGLLEVILEE